LQINTAINYAYGKAATDPEFAQAFQRNEIGAVLSEYGLPPSNKSIDMAYDIWRGRMNQSNGQQQAQNEQVAAAKNALADEKSRAQLSTGGSRSGGSVSQQDLLDRMREEIMSPSVSPDQAVEIMKKKYKIDVGKSY
jgi:ABC-type glycerol-3-phosphate transport system substrate-binding protein